MAAAEYETSLSMSMNVLEPEVAATSENNVKHGVLPVENGGTVKITYDVKHFKPTYLDEYTREPLPRHLVQAAIRDELDYFNSKVWEFPVHNR